MPIKGEGMVMGTGLMCPGGAALLVGVNSAQIPLEIQISRYKVFDYFSKPH